MPITSATSRPVCMVSASGRRESGSPDRDRRQYSGGKGRAGLGVRRRWHAPVAWRRRRPSPSAAPAAAVAAAAAAAPPPRSSCNHPAPPRPLTSPAPPPLRMGVSVIPPPHSLDIQGDFQWGTRMIKCTNVGVLRCMMKNGTYALYIHSEVGNTVAILAAEG